MEPYYGWFWSQVTYVVGYYCSHTDTCVVYKPNGFCNMLAEGNSCNKPDCHMTKWDDRFNRMSLAIQKTISKLLRPLLLPFM